MWHFTRTFCHPAICSIFSWSSDFGALCKQLCFTARKPREVLQACKPTRTSSGWRTADLAEGEIRCVSILLQKVDLFFCFLCMRNNMIIHSFRIACKVSEVMITLTEAYLLYEKVHFPSFPSNDVLFEQIFTCYSSRLLNTGWTEIQFLL